MMANASNPSPVINEGTSLLVGDDNDDDRASTCPCHRLSSKVVERTGVLFQPDFTGEQDNIDGSRKFRRISITSTLATTTRRSITEASGIASGKMNNSNMGPMIGTITTSSVLNLVVATAGGIGMVTLPGSFAQVGWLEGLLLLVIAGAAAASSLFLLDWACKAVAAKERGKDDSFNASSATSSYASLVATTLGNVGSQTLELLTLAYCTGQVVAYLGAIGGQVHALLSLFDINGATIHDCIVIVALGFMFPLSLLPEEGAMRFAGLLGTICMIYIASAVFLGDGFGAMKHGGICSLADDGSGPNSGTMAYTSNYITLLKNLPIFLFSMNASVTYVPVRYQHQTCLSELLVGNMTVRHESNKMIITAIAAAGFFYQVCSGVAYVAYCEQVPENVVDVWPLTWIPGSVARLFLAVELTMAAAGIYVPLGRAALWHLIFGPYETVAAKGVTRTLATFGLISFGAIGSIVLGGALALPLAITSALCVTAQMFVLPGLCVSALLVESEIGTIPGGRLVAVGFALFGAIFGLLSLVALFGLL